MEHLVCEHDVAWQMFKFEGNRDFGGSSLIIFCELLVWNIFYVPQYIE